MDGGDVDYAARVASTHIVILFFFCLHENSSSLQAVLCEADGE